MWCASTANGLYRTATFRCSSDYGSVNMSKLRMKKRFCRIISWLGLSSREDYPLRKVISMPRDDDDRRFLAEFISNQIEVEQNLSSSRMTWNLTFQGFTIAGYALLATADGASPARFWMQFLVASVSIVIAFATWRGITASQQQRAYLRRTWTETGLNQHFPQPFSAPSGSRLGRSPPVWMCCSLIVMWLVLIPASHWLRDPPDAKAVHVSFRP